jgi:hypothetical protein
VSHTARIFLATALGIGFATLLQYGLAAVFHVPVHSRALESAGTLAGILSAFAIFDALERRAQQR